MTILIKYTLIYTAVLLLVALGGCFSERSGVINLGLEGIMIMGALGGALVMNFFPNLPAQVLLVSVFAGSILLGLLFSLLLAVPAVSFGADQTLTGTALNMMGLALATVIVKCVNLSVSPDNSSAILSFLTQKQTLAVEFPVGIQFSWFVVIALIALIVAVFLLKKTRFGLRLRACGEHPQAAASVGINVQKMRYAGVLISGILGGIGGIAYITAGVSEWNFSYGVSGFGFLALAVMIFGAWDPLRIALASLIFGFLRALANVYSAFDFLNALNIPGTVYNMLPYLICLLVLAIFSKRSVGPKAAGIPFDSGQR